MSYTITDSYPPSGLCPVQAEGKINGHPYYFKARYNTMALYVNTSEGATEVDPYDQKTWSYKEVSPGLSFEAGWAPTWECERFLDKAYALFVAQNPK